MQVYLFTCPICKLKYQLSSNVEVVNKFGWVKHTAERKRICKKCTKTDGV